MSIFRAILVWKVDKILTFTERAQKAVDVTSTFVQVLIGLSSVIIAAVLAFYQIV
jgi:hypothetical protein